jgi:hypothetical protein
VNIRTSAAVLAPFAFAIAFAITWLVLSHL